MQSEEFDKKVREAASHHHPAYDEQAWDKMHKLLDKHLPEEKDDRRRIIFYLLFFLLLGGGIWLLLGKLGEQPQKPISTQARQKDAHTSSGGNNVTGEIEGRNNQPRQTTTVSAKEVTIAGTPANTTKTTSQNQHSNFLSNKKMNNPVPVTDKIIAVLSGKESNKNINAGKEVQKNSDKDELSPDQQQKVKEELANRKESILPGVITNKKTENQPSANEKADTTILNKSIVQDSVAVNSVNKTAKKQADKKDKDKKTKNKKSNFFFVSLSAGPDVSYTTGGQLGTTKLTGGIGLGYTYKNRISVRTGFFSGRKVYAASPDAYNPPAIFWNYYPYLEKVDANCKVYEIPVLASYHFGKPGKQHWFVSAGLSSLIMKQEDYHYAYKYTPNGATLYRDWTVKNENKHFFSVATVSGGYQKSIGKSITFTAEPYLKLPLGGVGYGRVKLNSTGILFSVSVKPFQQNKQTDKKP